MWRTELDRGSMDKMLKFVFLVLLGIYSTEAVTHSMKYFYTASSQVPNFPEFVAVGYVDDVQMFHYDSNTQKAELTQDWAKLAADPQYSERNTQIAQGTQQTYKANIGIAKQRFNQTGGVHIFQKMYGCEWNDDETQQVTGYRQFGYDGEDFLTWNTETNTWIAPQQQAEISKNTWNNDKASLEFYKNYLNQICPEWLKKYVGYGRSSLMRTVRPSVFLLRKSSSSPVSCFATGFYPNRAEMFWRKDGEEIHDGVEKGEIVPNNDGTFQMNAHIDLSSVPTGDWNKYECVFQLSGDKEDVTHRLEKTRILTNDRFPTGAVVGGVFGGVAVLVGIIVGVLCWKKPPSGFKKANSSDTSSSSSGDSNPKKGNSEEEKMMKAIS